MPVIDLGTGVKPEEQKQENPGRIINLGTGGFVDPSLQPQQPVEVAEPGLTDKFFDLFTGELRQTETIKDLPEVISLDLGSTLDNLKLRSSLAITPNPEEKIALIKNNFPDAIFTTDEKGNVVADFGEGRKGVIDAPGVTLAGFGETLLEISAFIPAALGVGKVTQARATRGVPTTTTQKAGVGAVGAGLTQAGLESLQSAAGGTFDKDEIAIASALGGVAETVLPAIQAFRSSRRAKAIGAETEEVAQAVESIKPTTQALEGLEKATGESVSLFQAQQTQIPSELLKQRILPQLDAGARTAAQALETQNKEAFDATTALINTIAPEGSIVDASRRFRDISRKAIEVRKIRRSTGTKELFKDALKADVDVDLEPVVDLINENLIRGKFSDQLKSSMKKVGRLIGLEDGNLTTLFTVDAKTLIPRTKKKQPTLSQLQEAKFEIDAMLEKVGSGALSDTNKRRVTLIQQELVKQMEAASPLYKAANEEFRRLSPAVTELEESIIGQIAKKSDINLKDIASQLFNPKTELTDPIVIRNAKAVIDKVDPTAWDEILRVEMNRRLGGLEQLIEEIPGDFVGNIPGQLRRTLFGNPPQRKALLAGMNEEQKRNFKYLETVLKKASSGRAAGSPTAAFGQAIEKLKGVSIIIRDAIFKPLSTLQETGERGLFDRNVANLTRVMFDPDFKPQLNKLKKLNQDSPAAARALTQLLNEADSRERE